MPGSEALDHRVYPWLQRVMDPFEAVADPTRRAVIELLADGEATAGQIAGHFAISRPAVSRHLRLLREAGLLEVRAEGARRVYALRRDQLAHLHDWFAQRLNALDTELS